VCSVGWRNNARKKVSFWSGANCGMKGNQKGAEKGYYRIPRRIFLLED
jgi:hypothetical protein